MNAMNETSLTRAADPASVFIGSTLHTSSGSVALIGFEKGSHFMSVEGNPAKANYQAFRDAAEELTVPPVSSGPDAFELVGLMFVASGDMSETRLRRALSAVREASSRG